MAFPITHSWKSKHRSPSHSGQTMWPHSSPERSLHDLLLAAILGTGIRRAGPAFLSCLVSSLCGAEVHLDWTAVIMLVTLYQGSSLNSNLCRWDLPLWGPCACTRCPVLSHTCRNFKLTYFYPPCYLYAPEKHLDTVNTQCLVPALTNYFFSGPCIFLEIVYIWKLTLECWIQKSGKPSRVELNSTRMYHVISLSRAVCWVLWFQPGVRHSHKL